MCFVSIHIWKSRIPKKKVCNFVGGVRSPLLAHIVLNHLAWRLEALGYKFVRSADDFVVLCKTKLQAEKALAAVTAVCGGGSRVAAQPGQNPAHDLWSRVCFLGYAVSARTIRRGGKAEERFKMKIKALTRRSHNLDAAVVMPVNRVDPGDGPRLCHRLPRLPRAVQRTGSFDQNAHSVYEVEADLENG